MFCILFNFQTRSGFLHAIHSIELEHSKVHNTFHLYSVVILRAFRFGLFFPDQKPISVHKICMKISDVK